VIDIALIVGAILLAAIAWAALTSWFANRRPAPVEEPVALIVSAEQLAERRRKRDGTK
jgi:hypothetical protein